MKRKRPKKRASGKNESIFTCGAYYARVMKLKKNFLRTAAALASAVLFLSGTVQATPAVSADSAIVMDAACGAVLFEKNADARSLIASTTKIMTGLLVLERCSMDDAVTVPPEAVGIEGSSLYLKAGETLTVEALLYGMMLHSGNDAAVALAIHTCGSEQDFVCAMNERAQELGLRQTHFANPNGLDSEGNYSTARDLACLAAAALENERFRTVVSTKTATFGTRSFANHNKLLWQYPGAIGVKTGYTKAAGRILVSAAEKDGRRLIAVTISAPDDWNDHKKLLDEGFSCFEARTVLCGGDRIGSVPVLDGVQEEVGLTVQEDVSCMLLPQERIELRVLAPRFLCAPVQMGRAGTVQILTGKTVLAEIPIFYEASVEKKPEEPGFWERLFGGK